jgi:hypothetical protein
MSDGEFGAERSTHERYSLMEQKKRDILGEA